WGETPVSSSLNPNQVARMRIVADFPFTYTSRVRTELVKKQASNEMPAQYRRNDAAYEEFAGHFTKFLEALNERLLPELEGLSRPQWESALEAFTSVLRSRGLSIDPNDLAVILDNV